MSFEKQHYFVMMMDMVVKMITVALFLGYQSIVLLERARAVIKESEKNGCCLKFFFGFHSSSRNACSFEPVIDWYSVNK